VKGECIDERFNGPAATAAAKHEKSIISPERYRRSYRSGIIIGRWIRHGAEYSRARVSARGNIASPLAPSSRAV